MIERILAVIPARGGSRGLPGKNLRELAGVPLVGHSIAAAHAVPAVRRTLVSTDDEKIRPRRGASVLTFRSFALLSWPPTRHRPGR